MTERLYLNDGHLSRCEASVLSCTKTDRGYDIVLDRTVFFPNAGGQPCDIGTLRIGDTSVSILGCDEGAGGVLLHHADAPIAENTVITAEIDYGRRFDLMQQHSGEHLLSFCAYDLFGAVNVGFHLALDYGTIDLDRPLTHEQVMAIERRANELANKNLPITARCYASEDEVKDLPLRKQAEGLTAPIRIVTIEGADQCTCCAPHVSHTGEIGLLFFADASPYKGGMRLTFLCGMRALTHVRAMHDTADAIARRFSTGRENALVAVEKQFEELSAAKKNEKALAAKCNAYLAKELREGAETIGKAKLAAYRVDGVAASQLRPLALQVLDGRMLVVLFAADSERVQYVVMTGKDFGIDAGELCAAINTTLNGKGGGRGTMAQGSASLPTGLDEAIDQLKGYFAARLRALR